MAEKEIKFKLTADGSGLNSALDTAQQKAKATEEQAKKSAMSFGQIASAIASAFAGAKIIGFFSKAADEASKLEQAMAKVSATARALGQNTDAAKQAALSLANDGFLSANQAAQALSNLMQTGLSLQQAKKFIEASKDITAFGNTIGDAGQAVEDLTLGLLRGSALVIDNASPALKSLSSQYEKVLNTSGKAAAAQYAYNAIMKESAKFAGDAARYMDTARGAQQRLAAATDSAAAAIGKALEPAIRAVTNALTSVIESFTKWFEKLSPTAQTIAVLGAGFIALLPVIASLIPVVKGLSLAFAGLLANPVVLMLAGIAAAVTAVGVGVATLIDEFSDTKGEKLLKERQALLDIQQKQELSIEQKKRLAELNGQIEKSYDPILKKLKLENLNLEDKLRLLRAIDKARERAGKSLEEKERLRSELTERIKQSETEIKSETESIETLQPKYRTGRYYGMRLNELKRKKEKLEEDKAALAAMEPEPETKPRKDRDEVTRKLEEARYLETYEKLKKAEQDYKDTIALTNAALASRKIDKAEAERRNQQAKADFIQRQREERDALRAPYAQFIEEKNEAERLALQKRKEDALRASRELYEEEIRLAGPNIALIEEAELLSVEREKKIREAAIREETRLRLESIAETAKAAEQMTSAFAQIVKAKDAGGAISGVGGLLSGASGLSRFLPGLSVLGPAGAAVGAVGGIVSTLTDLFGKSDEERQREAEEQKRRDEEAKAILELQANYQKNMLALQEQQAKLPFENLQRQLRLIDIQAQQKRLAGQDEATVENERLEARRAAIQQVITEQAGTIAGGRLFGNVEATPQSLTQFLSERAGQSTALSQFVSLFAQGAQTGSYNLLQIIGRQLESYRGKIDEGIFAVFQKVVDLNIENAIENKINELERQHPFVFSEAERSSIRQGLMADQSWISDRQKYASFVTSASYQQLLPQLLELQSEVTSDTSVAENLLSTIEQSLTTQLEIEKNTKKTAENTSLQLEQDRGAAFIDIAAGGLRQYGNFLSGVSPITFASQAASVVLSSLAADTARKTDNELLSELVAINKDMRLLLAEIALNTNRAAGNFAGLTESELVAMIDNLRSRS